MSVITFDAPGLKQSRIFTFTSVVIGRFFRLFFAGETVGDAGRRVLEDRFNEIVRGHDSLITKICFGYARSRAELDDLRQDALVNIWQGLANFRGESSVKTWVYRVTLNTCVSTLRKRKPDVSGTELPELYDVIDDSAEKRMMLAELHECISRLPPLDKAIVMLWLEGFSYEEMVDMVGMSRNGIASRLHRAKEKLRTII